MVHSRVLPRVAPSAVRRPRLERWLASHAAVPLRLLVAPAGSGKTTLLLKYLPNSAVDAAYCALPIECTSGQLFEAIASALAISPVPQSYESLLAVLRSAIVRPAELAIDDVDNAGPEAFTHLRRLIEEAPDSLTFIYTSRSRAAIDAKTWVARGVAVLCEQSRLAFDAAETQMLAETCAVSHSHADISRLLEECDGWAIVVSGAIRAAAEDSRSLREAYEQWRSRYRHVFTEFIGADLARASDEDRALIESIIAGANITDQVRLARLESRGLFVIADDGGFRPYRAIRRLRGQSTSAPAARLQPMTVRMFGRFQARIGGEEIAWIRRRDQQFIKYLLLKPNGSATRQELASVFWPSSDRQLAAQSVRTACSNIRKALAAVVGHACVNLYFRADPDVCLDLTNIVADVRRFSAHVDDGDAAYERGDTEDGAAHYRTAEEIYAGRLLDGEPEEAWFALAAQSFEERYTALLEQLAKDAFDRGDLRAAAQYADRVQRIRPERSGLVKMLGQVGLPYRAALGV